MKKPSVEDQQMKLKKYLDAFSQGRFCRKTFNKTMRKLRKAIKLVQRGIY